MLNEFACHFQFLKEEALLAAAEDQYGTYNTANQLNDKAQSTKGERQGDKAKQAALKETPASGCHWRLQSTLRYRQPWRQRKGSESESLESQRFSFQIWMRKAAFL